MITLLVGIQSSQLLPAGELAQRSGLTPSESARDQIRMLRGKCSECWARSFRNPARHQVGTVRTIISESARIVWVVLSSLRTQRSCFHLTLASIAWLGNSDDETVDQHAVRPVQKTGFVPEPFIGNGVRRSHHGLAATAVHSREAGYIYATGSVIFVVTNPYTDGVNHTFFDKSSRSAAASSICSASSFFSFAFSSSSASAAWLRRLPCRRTWPSNCRSSPRRPVFASQACCRRSSLMLLQHCDNLLFREPCPSIF